MLAEIGVASLEELFDRQIPAAVRLQRALDLPGGMAEQDVYAHLRALADKPEAINEDPYGDGWLARVKLSDPGEKDGLLDAATYTKSLS